MRIPPQEISQTYRTLSDDEIATLHAQIDTLTEDARAALASEIERRGMKSGQLSKLYASELRKEAKFDQRQKEHRKSVASYILRGDPKWTIITIVLLVVACAIFALISSHH